MAIQGVHAKPELNGQTGTVLGAQGAERVHVRLASGVEVALKPTNLAETSESEAMRRGLGNIHTVSKVFTEAEPEKQKWEYTAREKIDKALAIKTEATTAFKAEEWWAAREKYDEAAESVGRDSIARTKGREDGDKPAAQELHVACLLNAAQCSLKLSDWPTASTVCTKVLGLKELPMPSRIKALFRRGTARLKMADFDGARADLKEACTLEPRSKEIREMYGSIKEAEAAAKQSEKGLFAKMVKGAGGIKKKPPEGVQLDAVVRKVIHDWDPYDLLHKCGAPEDEWDHEIRRIVGRVGGIHSAADAAAVVSEVFTQAFPDPERFGLDNCAEVGKKLFTALQDAG